MGPLIHITKGKQVKIPATTIILGILLLVLPGFNALGAVLLAFGLGWSFSDGGRSLGAPKKRRELY